MYWPWFLYLSEQCINIAYPMARAVQGETIVIFVWYLIDWNWFSVENKF